MKPKNFLFIGGSQDGQFMALPEEQPTLRFPVYEPIKVEPEIGIMPPKAVDYSFEHYQLERFRVEDKTYFLYRHESLTAAEMFEKLLAGYKQEAS